MSDSPDDLESLLTSIWPMGRFHRYDFSFAEEVHVQTSYIFKNVIALRLDAPEEASKVDTPEMKLDRWLYRNSLIRRISDKIERSTCTEVDVHTFAISFFKIIVDEYYPSSVFVLHAPLTAFALSKGIWLLALKFIFTNSRDESILMVLKNVKEFFLKSWQNPREKTFLSDQYFNFYISLLSSSSVATKPRDNWESMGSLYNLIKVMFDVGLLVILIGRDFYEFMPEHQKSEFCSLALVTIYWIISGVFVCSSQCDKLSQNEYVIQDGNQLREIHEQLISIHERLLKFENSGKEAMDDEKIALQYEISNTLGGSGFMALFDLPNESEDIRLLRCDMKDITIPVEASRKGRILMLLISDLDISSNEIVFLKEFYVESKKTSVQLNFELIWLPILNGPWTASLEGKYKKLLQTMSWNTIDHQRFITEETKMFIRNIWKFRRQPIIVVLNEHGRVVCPNAIHLLHIWGSKAFPFTRQRERTLWSAENRHSSLVLGFDSEISSMREAGKWIILYGGNNIDWIQRFTKCVGKVSSDFGIQIELLYVGTNREEKSLISENVSQSYSSDMKKIWYFWTRLESLLISRYQIFATTSDGATDPIIQEVKKLLSYASAESWACLSTPSSDQMIHGLGDTMLQGFMEYESWKQNIHSEEFPKYFKKHVQDLERQSLDRTCSRIVLRIDNKDTIENLKCPDCRNSMEKKIMYRCCHERNEFD